MTPNNINNISKLINPFRQADEKGSNEYLGSMEGSITIWQYLAVFGLVVLMSLAIVTI